MIADFDADDVYIYKLIGRYKGPERGRPRWGPARATVEEAVADRKAMRAAIKAGALDEWLRRLRPPAEASRER